MTSLHKIREIVEDGIDRVEKDLTKKQTDLHAYYLKGLLDAYKYTLDMIRILEAKEGTLVKDECDG